MEARRGLGKESDCIFVQAARDAEVLDVGAGKRCGFLPPIVRRQKEIFGPDQIAHAAALVGFFDAGPEAVEFLSEFFGLVGQDRSVGEADRRWCGRLRRRGSKIPSREKH